ncbi:protein O-glucosyltransferase 2-like isoform X2 [Oscarella lobularis]|uniref:protein O-glucosyltransferase 2-like isoform X2 n=1 Tax=Oscarella lobularis TaxID=121494 RepID=UPI0033137204
MWLTKAVILTGLLLSSTVEKGTSEPLGKKSTLWGPGLQNGGPLPVRYFFLQAANEQGINYTTSPGIESFIIRVRGEPSRDSGRIRVWIDKLDRRDGTFIVRYRLYATHDEVHVEITNSDGVHLDASPYRLVGPVRHEDCACSTRNATAWRASMNCRASEPQVRASLSHFDVASIDLDATVTTMRDRFRDGSFAHYTIVKNRVYRTTLGSIVGFKQFSDAILLSLARKVRLPDVEFFVNLGDYPVAIARPFLPIFSWCGSTESGDIVMPTYDVTQSTMEMLGRVSLDLLSVQGNTGPSWDEKVEKGFWRGRDSRQERLDFVSMARNRTDMFDAALTNFFFFEHDEKKYGPKVKHISFFDFFKYKYQINIDGTVAAYRLPYLLAGDAVVFKQDSSYYEHFYNELEPWVHYIPLKSDLSDVIEKIEWARSHDEEARQIGRNGQQFVRDHLMPPDIYCYLQKLFYEYSKRLKTKPKVRDGMELLEQPKECECSHEKKGKDEL